MYPRRPRFKTVDMSFWQVNHQLQLPVRKLQLPLAKESDEADRRSEKHGGKIQMWYLLQGSFNYPILEESNKYKTIFGESIF